MTPNTAILIDPGHVLVIGQRGHVACTVVKPHWPRFIVRLDDNNGTLRRVHFNNLFVPQCNHEAWFRACQLDTHTDVLKRSIDCADAMQCHPGHVWKSTETGDQP